MFCLEVTGLGEQYCRKTREHEHRSRFLRAENRGIRVWDAYLISAACFAGSTSASVSTVEWHLWPSKDGGGLCIKRRKALSRDSAGGTMTPAYIRSVCQQRDTIRGAWALAPPSHPALLLCVPCPQPRFRSICHHVWVLAGATLRGVLSGPPALEGLQRFRNNPKNVQVSPLEPLSTRQ